MSILEVNHIKKVYKTRMGGDRENLWRSWENPEVVRQRF